MEGCSKLRYSAKRLNSGTPLSLLKEGLKDGRVRKVAICIMDAESRAIERYMVSLSVKIPHKKSKKSLDDCISSILSIMLLKDTSIACKAR